MVAGGGQWRRRQYDRWMEQLRPNILFIMMDDLGWRDVSVYGSSFYETPSIDRLAAQGMRFTDAYAACPVCSPTRASILTGKYPATIGLTDYIDVSGQHHPTSGKLIDAPYIHHLPHSEKSVASALRDGGYQTWHVGKWHLGDADFYPTRHGFEVNIGGCEHGHPHRGFFSPWHLPTLPDAPDGTYLPDYLTDRAIDLIRHGCDRPFYLNLWYYLVHTPIEAPRALVEKYARKAQALGLDAVDPFVEGEHFPTGWQRARRVRRRVMQSDATYAAMIEVMDRNIGRILHTLDDLNLSDNTIVIFTSDNGGLSTAEGSPTSNLPLHEGKGWMYEGGTRVCLTVRWPKQVAPNQTSAVPVTSPDFYPTLLEMAGLAPLPQQHLDGVSIVPLLSGATALEREAIYWHYPHYGNQGGTPGSAVRCGDYKLIEFFEDGRLELYNLRRDVGELTNLAADLPDVVEKLHALLVAWRASVEAQLPEVNPNWDSFGRFGHIPD